MLPLAFGKQARREGMMLLSSVLLHNIKKCCASYLGN